MHPALSRAAQSLNPSDPLVGLFFSGPILDTAGSSRKGMVEMEGSMAEPTTPRPCLLLSFEHNSQITEAARTLSVTDSVVYFLASRPCTPDEIEHAIKAKDAVQTSLAKRLAATTGGEKTLSVLCSFRGLVKGKIPLSEKVIWTAFARVLGVEILIVEMSGRTLVHPPKVVARFAP